MNRLKNWNKLLFSGGLGGRGSRGINCRRKQRCFGGRFYVNYFHWCESSGNTGEAAREATGRSGSNGRGFLFVYSLILF